MVVDDFHVIRIAVAPNEAHAEPVVDSNAVLTTAVALESLQPVAREDGQVLQAMGGVQLPQFPLCHSCDASESPRHFPGQQTFGVLVPERPNHPCSISRYA